MFYILVIVAYDLYVQNISNVNKSLLKWTIVYNSIVLFFKLFSKFHTFRYMISTIDIA